MCRHCPLADMREIPYKYIIKVLVKRKLLVIISILFFVAFVSILHTNVSPDLYFMHWDRFENTSCHYSHVGDALRQIGDNFNPPSNSIYFHETSCHGLMNSRQACAVESAARIHKNWQIYVLFAGSVTYENLNSDGLKVLNQIENVHLRRVHIVKYAEGTPLESQVKNGALNRTRWRVSHTSDLLRYLSLYKWGGVYLDLDVVVVKSFEELASNWAARESDRDVAAGALAFSRDQMGRIIANATISDFKENFRGDSWGNNGPGVITRVLKSVCGITDVSKLSAGLCNGFEVYGPELFYPVSYYDASAYFGEEELTLSEPYIYHVWNKLTEDLIVTKDSAYAKLAKKYCPAIYKLYGDSFGV